MSTSAEGTRAESSSGLSRFLKSSIQQVFVFAALILIYIFFMFAAPNFAEPKIALDIVQQAAYIGVPQEGPYKTDHYRY